MYLYVYVYIYVCMYVYIYVSMYNYVYVSIDLCMKIKKLSVHTRSSILNIIFLTRTL